MGVILIVLQDLFAVALGNGFVVTMLFSFLQGIVSLAFLIPSLAVGARRLHDIGRNAWFLLLCLLPIVGAIILLVFFVMPGNPLPNKYGEPTED